MMMDSKADSVYPYIPAETLPYIVDAESETLSGNQTFWGGLEIKNGGEVTVGESADIEVHKNLTLSDGAILVNNGNFTAESIIVNGKGNIISGKTISVHYIPTYHILDEPGYHIMNESAEYIIPWVPIFYLNGVTVKEGAELTISKDQYDAFRSINSEGSIFVQKSSGNPLRQKDIDELTFMNTIRNITFQQDLFDVKNLKFKDGTSLILCFEDAYGTEKNDSIRFCKNSHISFGGEGRVIDLLEGKNSIRTDANAVVSIFSDIFNISTIQISSGKKIREEGISHQHFTETSFHDVTFSENMTGKISIEDHAIVSTGILTGGFRSDKITVGHNSTLQTGDIRDFEVITIDSGIKWKEYSSDPGKTQGYTCWTAGNIENQNSLKISVGNYTDCSVGHVKVGIFSIEFSPEDVWEYAVDTSNDLIRIGKYSSFKASSVNLGNGKNAIFIGTGSNVEIEGDVKGIWKLQINGGSQNIRGYFSSGNIVGTEFSDLLSFGNYTKNTVQNISLADGWAERPGNDCITVGKHTEFNALSLTFGEGNDSFEIKDNAIVNINGLLDFGTGKDRLVIGQNAEVVLKAVSTDSLVKFSVGKNTRAFLSSELLSSQKLRASNAVLYDIGSAQDGVAQNFSSLSQEQADDSFETAQVLTDTEYAGWLCGENSLDFIDFFQKGTTAELKCDTSSEVLMISQWNSEGDLLSTAEFDGIVALDENAVKFSVELNYEHLRNKAVAYHFTLVEK